MLITLNFTFEIKKLMKENNISKKELVQKVGTSTGYLTRIFAGDVVLKLDMLAKILNVFNSRLEFSFKKTNQTSKLTKH